MSFRLKTILGIAAIEATLLLLLVGSGLSYLRSTGDSALATRAETSAMMFAATIKNAVMSTDVASLRSFFDEVATHRDLAYARLVDPSGRVIAQKQNAFTAGERVVSASSEITEGSIDFGRVEIALRAGEVDGTIAHAKRLFISLAALEMVLVAGFSVLLGNYLTKRLKLLQTAAEDISKGKLAGIPYRGAADEIGRTVLAFNQMAADLKRSAQDTEKYQMEAVAALEQAKAGSRAKSDFLATISHEIRTPLNGIMGGAQILREQSPDSEEAAIIIRSGERLMSLLNDVLDFSKVEAGKLELVPSPTDLRALVEELIPLYESAAKAHGVALTLERPNAPVWVEVDHNRVFQVMTNLLSNAVKFTQDGEVIVRLSCSDTVDHRVKAVITISDSGIGIPLEAQQRLFTPFTQADRDTSIRYGGTGLGLVIVERIVRMMGGSIDFTSLPGRGSTFHVRLELDKAAAPLAPDDHPVEALHKSEATYPQARVLLAEDDAVNRTVMLSMLKRLQIVPDVAVDGSEAFDRCVRDRYDLVLMDHRMPVMDGVEATIAIRDHERSTGSPHVPIIAVSANTSDDDLAQFTAAGMEDLLKKPIRLANLTAMLSRWLGEEHGAPHAAKAMVAAG